MIEQLTNLLYVVVLRSTIFLLGHIVRVQNKLGNIPGVQKIQQNYYPTGGAYIAAQIPQLVGRGLTAPGNNPTPHNSGLAKPLPIISHFQIPPTPMIGLGLHLDMGADKDGLGTELFFQLTKSI